MARGHPGLPKSTKPLILEKASLFSIVAGIDSDTKARDRVLKMENEFRRKIGTHLKSLPAEKAQFKKLNTNPFVLSFYSKQQGFRHVSEIEKLIVPAKVFSSMETSAGRMVEEVVLPVYGWESVGSSMQTDDSVIDGLKKQGSDLLKAVTLKSGPRCLNDDSARNTGLAIATHVPSWAVAHKVSNVDFTYGVLYGTKAISNKKDWHVLRTIAESVSVGGKVTDGPDQKWCVSYRKNNVNVTATVRLGMEWWSYLGGNTAWLEVIAALIRACIEPTSDALTAGNFMIPDLSSIISLEGMPEDYNISILQRSQLPWLLFLARHFCDGYASVH